MSLITFCKQVDRRLAGSFVVTVVLTIGSFIAGQLYDNKPKLRYQIISQAPVYDLRENVTTLDILFDGQSIRQQQQTLTLITLRIENSGNAGISKQTSFDELFLPGIRVSNSKVVKADILSASSDYLARGFNLKQISDGEFTFGPCIMDKGEFVVIKMLALHSEAVRPALTGFGKVANNARIDVITMASDGDKTGFFTRALAGDLATQAVRLIAYFLAFVLLLISIGSFIAFSSKSIQKVRRKRHVSLFRRTLSAESEKKQHEAVFDLYLKSGTGAVVRLNELFSNSELLRAELDMSRRSLELPSREIAHRGYVEFDMEAHVQIMAILRAYTNRNDDGTITIDSDALEATRSFEAFLVHQVPEQVFGARRQTQGVPFGTESTNAKGMAIEEPSVTPPSDA
jgi:hypothetical protein